MKLVDERNIDFHFLNNYRQQEQMDRFIRGIEVFLRSVIEKGRSLNQFVLASIYLALFISTFFVTIIFNPDTDYLYKGISLSFLIKLLFLPIPIILMPIAFLFKRAIVRNVGLLLSMPFALLFSFFALMAISDLVSILSKGYDPALEQVHRIDFGKYHVGIYRDVPHMTFDPYSILIRQEKELRHGILKTRRIYYQYRCHSADYEILDDNKIKVIFDAGIESKIFEIEPF